MRQLTFQSSAFQRADLPCWGPTWSSWPSPSPGSISTPWTIRASHRRGRLVPGWGGVYRLPRLIGAGNAVKVMIGNALANNKVLDGTAAFEPGNADAVFAPGNFLDQSLARAATILTADPQVLDALTARRKDKADCTAPAGVPPSPPAAPWSRPKPPVPRRRRHDFLGQSKTVGTR